MDYIFSQIVQKVDLKKKSFHKQHIYDLEKNICVNETNEVLVSMLKFPSLEKFLKGEILK